MQLTPRRESSGCNGWRKKNEMNPLNKPPRALKQLMRTLLNSNTDAHASSELEFCFRSTRPLECPNVLCLAAGNEFGSLRGQKSEKKELAEWQQDREREREGVLFVVSVMEHIIRRWIIHMSVWWSKIESTDVSWRRGRREREKAVASAKYNKGHTNTGTNKRNQQVNSGRSKQSEHWEGRQK